MTDDDLAQTCGNLSVTIANVVPTVTASNHTIDENGLATVSGTISDPGLLDAFSLIINWADGPIDTIALPAGTQTFSETHQYLDDNPSGDPSDNYSVALSANDGVDAGAASATVTVNNVPPSVTISGDTIDENGIATLNGVITDPGTLDTFDVTIVWGDGASESFSLPATTTGTTPFSKTHQYLDDNPTATFSDTYTVSVTVTDDDSGSGSATTFVNVNNVAPVVDAGTFQSVVVQEETFTSSGAFTDVGTQDTHTAKVNYGDGSGTTTLTLNPDNTFDLSHAYLYVGEATTTVEVCDDDGECGVSIAQILILAADPTVTVTGPTP